MRLGKALIGGNLIERRSLGVISIRHQTAQVVGAISVVLGGGIVGGGTIYKLAPDGTFTILHSFTNQPDGDDPMGGVVFDKQGNLYTTTEEGGATTNGTVIKLTP